MHREELQVSHYYHQCRSKKVRRPLLMSQGSHCWVAYATLLVEKNTDACAARPKPG